MPFAFGYHLLLMLLLVCRDPERVLLRVLLQRGLPLDVIRHDVVRRRGVLDLHLLLGLLIVALQAYIFMMLTIVYLSMACQHDH